MHRYVIERAIPDIGSAERSGFLATIVTDHERAIVDTMVAPAEQAFNAIARSSLDRSLLRPGQS